MTSASSKEAASEASEVERPPPSSTRRRFRVLARLGTELLVVMLGVLLALGAENWARNREWAEQAKVAKRLIDNELAEARLDAAERLAVQPCLRGQIGALNRQLLQGGPGWVGMPAKFSPAASISRFRYELRPAYRAPTRLWRNDAWETAISSDVLRHMPASAVAAYSQVYRRMSRMRDDQEREAAAAARMTVLSNDLLLGHESRLEMLDALAQVDRANASLETAALQLIDIARPLLAGHRAEDAQRDMRAMISVQRNARGDCVRSLRLNI
jgi:type II secretory pathway pseudopilin PulG